MFVLGLQTLSDCRPELAASMAEETSRARGRQSTFNGVPVAAGEGRCKWQIGRDSMPY